MWHLFSIVEPDIQAVYLKNKHIWLISRDIDVRSSGRLGHQMPTLTPVALRFQTIRVLVTEKLACQRLVCCRGIRCEANEKKLPKARVSISARSIGLGAVGSALQLVWILGGGWPASSGVMTAMHPVRKWQEAARHSVFPKVWNQLVWTWHYRTIWNKLWGLVYVLFFPFPLPWII